jgi:hypothetical protein
MVAGAGFEPVGFTNIFGYFNEVDFLMDDVIARFAARK